MDKQQSWEETIQAAGEASGASNPWPKQITDFLETEAGRKLFRRFFGARWRADEPAGEAALDEVRRRFCEHLVANGGSGLDAIRAMMAEDPQTYLDAQAHVDELRSAKE